MAVESLSREQLLELVSRQAGMIAELEGLVEQLRERIAELEGRGGGASSASSSAAFIKPNRHQAPSCKEPRKRRSQAFVRRRDVPTQRVEHALLLQREVLARNLLPA
jgi:hypothetical protein